MNVCSVGKLFFSLFLVSPSVGTVMGKWFHITKITNDSRLQFVCFVHTSNYSLCKKTSFDLITLFTAKQLDQSVVVHTMEPSRCLICNIIFCIKTSYSVDAKIVRLTTIDMATPYTKIVCQHLRYKIDANFLSHLSHKKVRTFYMVY